MSVVNFGAVPCGCPECKLGAVGAPPNVGAGGVAGVAVGAGHGGHHHLPAALKAHEFKDKLPGDQSKHYPMHVDFAGPGHDVTFRHS